MVKNLELVDEIIKFIIKKLGNKMGVTNIINISQKSNIKSSE